MRPLPKNYAPPETWHEFNAIEMPPPIARRELVGTDPQGRRWGIWPLIFEEYVSDSEPDLALSQQQGKLAYPRLVVWKRVARQDAPQGWHQWRNKPWRIDGYHELTSEYLARWNKKARHDLRAWQQQAASGRYAIEGISFEEFKKAYKHSTVQKKCGSFFLDILARKYAHPDTQDTLALWGVRDTHSGNIVAGTAAHYPIGRDDSLRECPFILPEARECQAATGLMHHWFEESMRRGRTRLMFTYFRQRGDPRSWQGFSTFKSHFATDYVAYPPVLWRLVGGKFF